MNIFYLKFSLNNNYKILCKFFNDYYDDFNKFLDISIHVGERFDLVQAGGGNTSFKILVP